MEPTLYKTGKRRHHSLRGAEENGISFSGLDPVLGSLGQLIGLLTETSVDTYDLNPGWFTDPITETKNGITDNPDKFESLLGQVLGKVGGNAIGIPVQDAALLGTWYPIKNGQNDTGFYLVSYQKQNGPVLETVMGLGVLHSWQVPDNNPLLTINVWGLIPFVRIGNGNFHITFDTPGYPLSLGIAAEGGVAGTPLVDVNGVSFNGVKFSALIDFPAPDPFNISLEVLSLQLPGDEKASNRSLADLAAISGEQILETATSLFIGALSQAFQGQDSRIHNLAPLLGLSSIVPGSQDIKMPLLQWYDLLKVASDPGKYPYGVRSVFINWFNTISSDPDLLKAWLSCLGGFLGNDQALITGTGARTDPFEVPILSISTIGQLNFSVATQVTGQGIRYFYPGLNFSGNNVPLGSSDAVFVLEAAIELAAFGLSGQAVTVSPDINFTFQFALNNKVTGQPLIAYDGYSFGSLAGGLTLGTGGKIVPAFSLTQVVTPQSSFDNINLLSPSELANAGAAVLSSALDTLIGVGQKSFSDNIAALIGLIVPGSAEGNWPAALAPPFSATEMADSILNPISAWAGYYQKTLQYGDQINGKAAFSYIVQEMALLLQNATGTVQIKVDGDGTNVSPWRAGISVSDLSLPAYLTAYQQTTADGGLSLIMGISLAPEITVAGTAIVPSIDLEAVCIQFPPNGSPLGVTASWFEEVRAKLSLPNGFQTPSLGGIVVSVSESQLSAGWSRSEGWSWSMFVNSPSLVIDGQTISLGQDLNFNDQTALEDLVKKSAASFSPFLVAALGAGLMRTETRAGLLFTGAMGLITQINQSPIFPSGLDWNGFTQLQLNSLSDPWPDIRSQLANNFSAADTSASLLSLLSWTIDPSLTTAPAIAGSGSFEDPYIAPLPKGFSAPVWFDPAGKILGVGAARNDSWQYQFTEPGTASVVKFDFDINSRLNLLKYDLANGTLILDTDAPSFILLGTLSNPDGPLINLPLSLGVLTTAEIGFSVSIQSGSIGFVPIVNLLGVILPGQPKKDQITLEDFLAVNFEAALQSAFLALFNAAVQAAVEQVKDKDQFKNLYDLLCILGLGLERKSATDPYGINTAGWTALLADFDSYIQNQLLGLLTRPADRQRLFAFLEQLFHITIPSLPTAALELLSGLSICGPADQGYPIYPQAILELVSDPLKGLQSRFQYLFSATNAEALQKLISELTKNIPSSKYGNFTFGTTSNGVIELVVLPTDAFALGSFLQISGGLLLDLSNRSLTSKLDLNCEKVGLTLQNALNLQYANSQVTTAVTSSIVWGDGTKPSAKSLNLVPFNSNDFLNQLADIAPAYTLNILLNAVFEEELLKKYPLIQQIFTGLGLATKTGAGSDDRIAAGLMIEGEPLWQMSSLMGILTDPLGWLLSDSVLGLNGKFNVAALVNLLNNLPEVSSSNGIKLAPAANGITISGLPYGFAIGMDGNNGTANFSFETKNISISDQWGILNDLLFVVSLDQNYQPAFSGSLVLSSGSKIPAAFFVSTGFDKEFFLSVSQGTYSSPSGLSVQLLPFQGWGSLAEQAARLSAAALLDTAVPALLQKLSDAGAKDFVDRMTQFGALMDVQSLVQQIINSIGSVKGTGNLADDPLEKIEAIALAWLLERFTEVKAPATVDAMIALLSGVVTGLSKENGRMVFQPGNGLPITIKAGLNSGQFLGLWVDLELPGTEMLKVDISETGVGVKMDGTVDFAFGIHLLVPVDGNNGPALGLNYVAGSGFVLNFDPLGDQTDFSYQSSLSRELVPVFFPAQGSKDDLTARIESWLLSVVKMVLPRYISALVLNIEKVKGWLEAPIITSTQQNVPTPAVLLEAVSLIIQNTNKTYSLNTLENLSKLTPEGFFGNLLFTLMQNELTLLTFGKDKQASISIGPKKGESGYYGLRIVAPDLTIDALPNLVLQLGDTATGADEWITKTGGKAGEPGIGFYIPITSTGGELSVDFTLFQLMLYNLGFDFVGTQGNPLVNLKRFTIGEIGPRVLFEIDFKGASSPDVYFGAAVSLTDIGLSLAPDKLVGNGGTNPIASNLLGSGADTTKGNPPANPAFSVTAAYSSNLWINLQSNTGNGTEIILPVQRSFGPLYIDSLGLGWEDKASLLDFLFSGDIDLAGLKTTVVGLKVGIPVKTPTDFSAYQVDMEGLDISFKGGSVEINGGFLKTEIKDPLTGQTDISYTGIAVIKAASFSLMALGSYAQVAVSADPGAAKAPSLFIFAVLNTPLGGPPAFFVTAIAAGFSYNRSINLPSINEVQNFPLLKGLVDGDFADGEDPGKALIALANVVQPEVGQYWLAAGIKFTSFELVTSSVLLFLSFGKDWEVNLLGLSFASLPPGIPRNVALAYFELAIKVSFKPAEGIISAEAQLTPNSFVLSTDCKVTGGFAFYLWYKDITGSDYVISAGDFVITLGGYHPAFQKPVYYPDVPRLGLQWKMDISVGSISISGGAYFALCPTAVMAGGYINVAFEMGPLKAWLNAYANFLIEWKPFYFNVGIGITVGASFGTVIAGVSVTLKAELGAKLNLEGPPTHGSVEVDWYVISFTIPIGSGDTATDDKNINWAGFADAFLPPAAVKSSIHGVAGDPVPQVVKWSPESGLLNSDDVLWTVQPYPFSISVKSAIPSSLITISGSAFSEAGVPVGVRPMGYTADLHSPLTISIINDKGVPVDPAARNITVTVYSNGAPSAMWAKTSLNRDQAPDPKNMLIPGASFGLIIEAFQYVYFGDIPVFDLLNLAFDYGDPKLLPYKNVAKYPPALRYPDSDQETAYHVIMNSIMDKDVATKRNLVFAALEQSAIAAPASPDLSVMAASANFILQALPVIARIGIYQNNGVADAFRNPPVAKRTIKSAQPSYKIVAPKLQGFLRRYKVKDSASKSKWMRTDGLIKKTSHPADLVSLCSADSKTLYDGGVVLWKLDEKAIHHIELKGDLPVYVSCFDIYGELLAYQYFEKSIKYLLPDNTAQVAVQGNDGLVSGTAGWQRDSILSKVNSAWALSDAAMMRVQNSQRIRVKTDRSHAGVIDAADLIKGNEVSGLNDKLHKGWIQSVFSGSTRYIGILVDKNSDAISAIEVSIGEGKVPMTAGQCSAVETIEGDGKTLVLFRSPASQPSPDYLGVLAVTKLQQTSIIGMYGFAELPAKEVALNTLLALPETGLEPGVAGFRSTIVSVHSKNKKP